MKALIVGGSKGIGLAFADKLYKKGYEILIVDKDKPTDVIFPHIFQQMNLVNCDFDLLNSFLDIDVLIITAGFGRVDFFDNEYDTEIKNMTLVNSLAYSRILSKFSKRIYSNSPFYCLVMGSIAGLIASPLFSVYGATKAYVNALVENINIELNFLNYSNRILCVNPGSLKGTSFNGGKTDTCLLDSLVVDCLDQMYKSKTNYIPEYKETYKNILDKYHNNPVKFGMDSINYKIENNRINKNKQFKIGYLSGTFDLFHIGHLNILKKAKEHCDYLIVGIHEDGSHKNKKVFIPFEERAEIVSSIKYVDKVIKSPLSDLTPYEEFHYDFLFVGSDYKGSKKFLEYEEFFKDKQAKIIYFPYTKGTSSTELRSAISKKKQNK